MANKKIEFHPSQGGGEDVAYVSLPGHPGRGTSGVTRKQVRLREIYADYVGPDLYLDFDEQKRLIGIEILA
jgi:hypothetical protein